MGWSVELSYEKVLFKKVGKVDTKSLSSSSVGRLKVFYFPSIWMSPTSLDVDVKEVVVSTGKLQVSQIVRQVS